MSGHSKWSQIKHQKGAADQKRGLTFTKLGSAITLSVRESAGNINPTTNFKLRLAIEKARQANMPKVNIDRAINKGLGKGQENNIEEVTYEGFGPGRVAILVQAATDNRQRTISSLKNIFTRFNGILSGSGTVSYMFEYLGIVKVRKGNAVFDTLMEVALEVGARDIKNNNDNVIFYTQAASLHEMHLKLQNKGLEIIESELIYSPITTMKVEDKAISEKILELVAQLEQADDVYKVASNYENS